MLRIGIAQVPQTAVIQENLDKAVEYMEKAKNEGVELLCFPETHLSGYRACVLQPNAPCDADSLTCALETLKAKCADLSLGIIIGTETPNPGGKPFNSAVTINEKGEVIAVTHKLKLTPTDARAYEFPETGPSLFTFKGIPMGSVICFEAYRYPEQTRELVRRGAKIVVQPQYNDFDESRKWKQPVFESLIVARGAENNIYFISANVCHPYNNVRSLVIDPVGLIQAASELAQEMLLVTDINPDLAKRAFVMENLDDLAKAMGAVI